MHKRRHAAFQYSAVAVSIINLFHIHIGNHDLIVKNRASGFRKLAE